MSTTLTYLAGTIQSLLTTELNSLASGALCLGSAVTLTSAGYPNGEVELNLGAPGGTLTAGAAILVWFLVDPDGTNYEDGGTSVTPARAPAVVIPLRAVSTAQRVTLRDITLPPGTFKALALSSGLGQTLASSGNTLKVLPYTYQAV